MNKQERNAERNRVMWSAVLLTSEGEVPVRVRDLSSSGAQLVAQRSLSPGIDVILRHRGLFAAANVKWVKADELGLEFYREIAEPALTVANG